MSWEYFAVGLEPYVPDANISYVFRYIALVLSRLTETSYTASCDDIGTIRVNFAHTNPICHIRDHTVGEGLWMIPYQAALGAKNEQPRIRKSPQTVWGP